jgi:hypothetical protein
MRLITLPLILTAAFGQTTEQSRTFTFAHSATPQQLQEVTNTVRSIAATQKATADPGSQSVTVAADPARMNAISWIMVEVDRPGDAGAQSLIVRQYEFPDERNPAIRLFRPAHLLSPVHLQETVNTIRSIAELQRVIALTGPSAIVVRGSVEQAALAEWIVRELDQPTPGASHEYTVPGWNDGVARVFFLRRGITPQEVQQKTTQVRTELQIPRTIGIAFPPAIVIRGTAEQVATAERILR